MMNQARLQCPPRSVERKKSVQIVSPKTETNTPPLRSVQSEDAIGKNFQVDVVDKDRKFVITCVDQTSGSDQDLTENGSSSNESGICNGSAESGVMFAIGDQLLQRDKIGSKNLPAFVITTDAVSYTHLDVLLKTATDVAPDSPRPSVGDVSATLPTVSSRFHIVKLASDPFKRGRWLCKEFEGDDPSKKASSMLSTNSSKASTASLPAQSTENVELQAPKRKFTVLPVITDTGPTTTSSNVITTEANSLTTVTEEHQNDPYPVTGTMVDTAGACTSPKQGEAGNSLLDTLLPGGQLNAEQMLLQGMNDSVSFFFYKNILLLSLTWIKQTDHMGLMSVLVQSEQRTVVQQSYCFIKALTAEATTFWPNERRYSEPAPSLSLKILLDTLYGDTSQAATGGGTTSANGSGSSVVAIDNKIEQAMDLVKTHLLYAVREEVEVLRDRIAELEKKLSRLEVENKMLRETAPPDLVAQVCSGLPLSINTTVPNSSTISNANFGSSSMMNTAPSYSSDDRCSNVDKLNSNCSSADR
ncbi:TSC22 domain family protein 1 [Trichinella pseudospiralis]|uniref:TSC22 domain family protein 1 n=1 Tax=Trichinella pseudospiralis TaxID=6337 RepID=A0A0V0Y3T2_TRIPS|nr:TSC22 domain family protein 1 [Trichinella pseudospiralis]